jgi:hypothetical protein
MMIRIHSKSKKKKLTKKQLQDQQDFMASINKIPLPSGGKYPAVATQKVKEKSLMPYRVPRDIKHIPSLPDTHKGALTKTGIMKDYHKLSPADREIVNDVASCTAPMHKGNYVYVTPGMNPAGLGRKNEVL